MTTAPRLLAVHAHPDDETLSTGALLATWAQAGWPVQVITATRGEQGEVIPTELKHLEQDPAALANHRVSEYERALSHLGVEDFAFLDEVAPTGPITDSGMSWLSPGQAGAAPTAAPSALVKQDQEALATHLARRISEFAPDVIVTYEPGGGYGHPDHVRVHELTMRAVALADRAVTVLWAVIPQDALLAVRAGLAASGAVKRLCQGKPELYLPNFSPDAGPIPLPAMSRENLAPSDLLQVATAPVLPQLAAALRAYPTQVQAVHELYDASPALLCCALSHHELLGIGSTEFYQMARSGGEWPQLEGLIWPVSQVHINPRHNRDSQVG